VVGGAGNELGSTRPRRTPASETEHTSGNRSPWQGTGIEAGNEERNMRRYENKTDLAGALVNQQK
jgi:hypothetical protein